VEFIRRNTNVLFVFILPVYLYIVQNSIQNKHTHVYANGIVITHSHPGCNTDGEGNEHDHSQREICLYSSISFDFYEVSPLSQVEFIKPEYDCHFLIEDEIVDCVDHAIIRIPRAPPA
jgi:hypothetical protein